MTIKQGVRGGFYAAFGVMTFEMVVLLKTHLIGCSAGANLYKAP